MSPRMTAVTALLVCVGALSGCGGGNAPSDVQESAQDLANQLSSLANDLPSAPAEDQSTVDASSEPEADQPTAAPEAAAMSDAEIGALVCPSLAENAADVAAGTAQPVLIQANFTIATLASTDQALANAALITERADAVAADQCPEDLATVLTAVGLNSLSSLYSDPVE